MAGKPAVFLTRRANGVGRAVGAGCKASTIRNRVALVKNLQPLKNRACEVVRVAVKRLLAGRSDVAPRPEPIPRTAVVREGRRVLDLSSFSASRGAAMVAANKRLLNLVRRLAIRDELLAMRLRNRLIVPQAQPPRTNQT